MINTQEIRSIIENLFGDGVIYRADEESIYAVQNGESTHTAIVFDKTYLLYDNQKTLDRLQFMVKSPEIISELLNEIERLQDYEYKYNSCNK